MGKKLQSSFQIRFLSIFERTRIFRVRKRKEPRTRKYGGESDDSRGFESKIRGIPDPARASPVMRGRRSVVTLLLSLFVNRDGGKTAVTRPLHLRRLIPV